jgi:hypothetical protein
VYNYLAPVYARCSVPSLWYMSFVDVECSAAFAAIDSLVLRLCRAVDSLYLFIKPRLLDGNNVNLAAIVKRYRGEAIACYSVLVEYT